MTTNNPTDTNQAIKQSNRGTIKPTIKEVHMTNQASEADKAIMIGFLYGIQSDFLPADEVRHRMAGFRHTQGYKDALAIIRTEQKKLLDNLEKKSTHYTPDGLVADGLDPWAVSVSTICDERNKLEAEL